MFKASFFVWCVLVVKMLNCVWCLNFCKVLKVLFLSEAGHLDGHLDGHIL